MLDSEYTEYAVFKKNNVSGDVRGEETARHSATWGYGAGKTGSSGITGAVEKLGPAAFRLGREKPQARAPVPREKVF
jgi:hypothetical protein